MSKCLNDSTLIGYLGADPEPKSETGDFATVSLALNESRKDESGKEHTRTDWVPLLLNNRHAKFALQYLAKGSWVLVKGKLRVSNWQDEAGNHHSKLQFQVLHLQALDKVDIETENEETEECHAKPLKFEAKAKTQYPAKKGNFYKKSFPK